MPISVGDGFTVGNDQPVDARFALANSTERFGLAADNVFEGLTVYQTGSGVEGYFILTDLSNYNNSSGWTEIPLGSGASGSSGTSGTSGSSGTSGLTGSSGTSGTSGSSGTSGTSGSSGTSGTSGSSGTSGTSGSSGTSGLTGSSGTSGTSGSSGTSGVNGTSGSSGTSGTSGSSGTSGTSGSSGTSGTSGSSGTSSNIAGNRYIVRATADENGEVEFNAAGDIQFYTIDADGNNIGNWVNTWAGVTLNSDGYGVVTFQSASVTLQFEITQLQGSYSPWDFDGNFVVGASNTFSDGDEVFITNFSKYGESGTSGSSGTSGISGSSGTSGLTGSSGTSGTSGSSGTSGVNGISGSSGTSGTSGSSGTSGTSGSSGTSGVNGISGSSGTSGTSGSSGTSGISGSPGTSGTSGSSGTSGANGISGSSGSSGTSVSISSPTLDGVLTSDNTANGAVANANLTFDGTELVLTGEATITDSLTVNGSTTLGDAGADTVNINAATITIPNVAGGTTNTAIIKDGSNRLKTRTIDSRVWGSALMSLESTGGGGSAQYRIPTFTSTFNTITGSGNFTFNTSTNHALVTGTAAVTEGFSPGYVNVSSQGAASGVPGRGSRVWDNPADSTSTSAGRIVVYKSTGWTTANAHSATQQDYAGLLAVSLTSGTVADGLILQGVAYVGVDVGGNVGDVVYLAGGTDAGKGSTTAPGSGYTVRVIGYKLSTTLIYFDPSPDWIIKT